MIKRIWAIAGVTLREAVRSRFVISMLLLLAVVNIVLPLLVRGDGTAAGMVNILLRYTLGTSGTLLGVATLWLACGSVSLELASHRMHHILTKPVHPLDLWLGKWLGLVALNAMLLLASYLTVLGFMQIRLGRLSGGDVDRAAIHALVLQPHSRFLPEPDDVSEEVQQRFTSILEKDLIPEGVRKSHVRETLTRRVRAARAVVGPGSAREWVLNVPGYVDQRRAVFLRANVIPPLGRLPRVDGEWHIQRLSHKAGDEPLFVAAQRVYEQSRLEIPAGVLVPGEQVVVRFRNATLGNEPDSALFGVEGPVAFLQPEGHFLGSYLAAWCMQLLQLVAVCSFGLLCGTCLSFPVASFAAAAILCVALIGHSVTGALDSETSLHSQDQKRSGVHRMLNHAGETLIEGAELLAGPAFDLNPLPLLADGVRVRWRDVGGAASILVLIYGGLSASLSTLVLRRRDLAVAGGVS